MKEINFEHKMAAHCESGTVTALLNHNGLEITEPMLFGIASGIFFGYFESSNFPFPMFIVRNKPGSMRKNIAKRLGIKFYTKSFKKPEQGIEELDMLLAEGHPVATQVDFYYMEFLPEFMRAHINVHFVNIVGKNEKNYLVSDSYHRHKAELGVEVLNKARFVGGYMAPKGFLFYPKHIPQNIDFDKAIIKGIKKAAFDMTKLPVPFVGIKGMRKFAKKVVGWPELARDIDHLSHEVMKINVLLEDQGTGGAGFRFLYATFLQQASQKINDSQLEGMSKRMMAIGDDWRNISYFAAKIGKNRDLGTERMNELSQMIYNMADQEQAFFSELYKIVK